MTGSTRRILRIILHQDVWSTVEEARQALKGRGISTIRLLQAIECPKVRQTITEALVDIADLTLQHQSALHNGARFETTVQNSDES